MTGIYMYVNKINGKRYIGQSINIEKRKRQHLKEPSPYSKFDHYLKKIGEENFDFIIIEECLAEELNEKEKFWINYYNSIKEGYNLVPGGNDYIGESNPWAKLSEEEVKKIIVLLEQAKLNNAQIAKQFNVHRNTIDGINRC